MAASLLASKPLVLHVHPNGNDAFSGRTALVRATRGDGPVASLDRALKLAWATRKDGATEPIEVRLAPGRYFTPKSCEVFDMADLIISGNKARIVGGVLLQNWTATENGVLWAHLPSPLVPVSLFGPNGRIRRARVPEEGWLTIADSLEPSPEFKGKGWDRFKFNPGVLNPAWSNWNGIEITTIHVWGMSRLRVKSIDPVANVLTLTASTGFDSFWTSFQKGGRYAAENVLEALKPGRFYADALRKRVGYRPRPGEKEAELEIVCPTTERLLVLKNCKNVTLQGLIFENAGYETPGAGRNFPQAEADLPAVIEAIGCDGLTVRNCTVRQCDVYGITLGVGTRNSTVERCTLADLGAGGIRIGGLAYEADENKVAGRNTVRNCLLQRLGRVHPAAVAVLIGHSPYNTVEHNDIDDLYYTGISVGWSWGYGPSNAHHNRIAFNHIRNLGQGLLSDMGGVYHLGVAPGTVIENNLIHDVKSHSYGGWGLYTDEGSSHVMMRNNVVFRTKSAGFHQHYGKENVIRNNVFAYGGEAQLMRTREEEHFSFRFENNIVLWSGAPLLGMNWSNGRYAMDRNLYWRTDSLPVDFMGLSLADWQAKGHDVHSLIADPLFVNPSKGDFRLKPGSPALKLGFQPIDVSKTGRLPNRS